MDHTSMPQEAAPTVIPSVTSVPEQENAKHAKKEPTSTTVLVLQPAQLDSTQTKDPHHAAAATKPALNAVMEPPSTAQSVLPTTSSTRPPVFHNVQLTNLPQQTTVTIVTQPVDHARTIAPALLAPDNLFSSKVSANNHAPTEPIPTKTNNVLLVTEDVRLVSDH